MSIEDKLTELEYAFADLAKNCLDKNTPQVYIESVEASLIRLSLIVGTLLAPMPDKTTTAFKVLVGQRVSDLKASWATQDVMDRMMKAGKK
jgi:hypothetical protein